LAKMDSKYSYETVCKKSEDEWVTIVVITRVRE
jgi:hypothetical protein